MSYPVPWTVTYENQFGKVRVTNVTSPIGVSPCPKDLSLQLELEGAKIISMVRGHHAVTAVTFQREDYDK
tara:strand:+ start:5033 stop:5242 length:210 start_codon:yes stop_codon:yes gene_type:complete